MSTEHTHPTPAQAREQLSASEHRSLRSAGDRRIHAGGTAILGLSIGLLMAPRNLASGVGSVALGALFVALWMGGVVWIERRARTVPRRVRLWQRIGISASFVLALGAVLPWLNLRAQTDANTLGMVAVAVLVIATPSLLAAAAIVGGRR